MRIESFALAFAFCLTTNAAALAQQNSEANEPLIARSVIQQGKCLSIGWKCGRRQDHYCEGNDAFLCVPVKSGSDTCEILKFQDGCGSKKPQIIGSPGATTDGTWGLCANMVCNPQCGKACRTNFYFKEACTIDQVGDGSCEPTPTGLPIIF